MTPARLSNHQRLKTTITVHIDGRDLSRWTTAVRLDTEFEIVDRQGQRFPWHGSIDLQEVPAGTHRPDLYYAKEMFVMPGNYTAFVSLSDSASGEGGAARHTFFVPRLPNDPLPRAWRDLPPVEFLADEDTPDRWFQPSVSGRLYLPLDTTGPLNVEVLVNGTPTEAGGVSAHTNDLNMGVLIPALKALSEINAYQGLLGVTMIDLTSRREIFSQPGLRELNWSVLRDALRGADPNVVDVKSLANREERVQFFLQEVSQRVEAALQPDEPPHVLIILSGPVTFEDKVAMQPIATTGNDNCKVYYIRYGWGLLHPELTAGQGGVVVVPRVNSTPRPPVGVPVSPGVRGSRENQPGAPLGSEGVPVTASTPHSVPQDDSLEATLKPLKPRLFDVDSPLGFRRALAEILAELSKF